VAIGNHQVSFAASRAPGRLLDRQRKRAMDVETWEGLARCAKMRDKDNYAHARELARRMAAVLNNEAASEASIAVAILIAGVVAANTHKPREAETLLQGIQELSERFLHTWVGARNHRKMN
jgi:hypothetical protein